MSEDRQTRKPDDSEDETTVLSKSLSDGSKRSIAVPTYIRFILTSRYSVWVSNCGVDFKITDNKSVSRRHAYITKT